MTSAETLTKIGALTSKARVDFLSSCPEPWGGCEELWSGAAQILARNGHEVSACKTYAQPHHGRIQALEAAGIHVDDYWQLRFPRIKRYLHSLLPRRFHYLPEGEDECWVIFTQRLREKSPDMAIISQGENFDGLRFTRACLLLGIPYMLICQKASETNWPPDYIRSDMQRAYSEAKRVYFVSEHNWRLTERQMGRRITNAEVVRNPYQTKADAALPYPATANDKFRLACVARLFILEKGQDALLEILSTEKWRRRNVEVNFYGDGIHRQALESAAQMLGLTNVSFRGLTDDITKVWEDHHALVLPSRAEGLPLVLVEAMLCGRPVIVTNAGGNAEVVDDEKTGFISKGTDMASFDETLDRAWQRRHEWEQIGLEAARRIRGLVGPDPCGEFASRIVSAYSRQEVNVPANGISIQPQIGASIEGTRAIDLRAGVEATATNHA